MGLPLPYVSGEESVFTDSPLFFIKFNRAVRPCLLPITNTFCDRCIIVSRYLDSAYGIRTAVGGMYDLPISNVNSHMRNGAVIENQISGLQIIHGNDLCRCICSGGPGRCTGSLICRNAGNADSKMFHDLHGKSGAVCAVCQTGTAI